MASPSLTAFIESYSSVDWKSPLPDEDFYEYRDDFLTDLGLSISIDDAERKLRQF